jgi:hypothetical protein
MPHLQSLGDDVFLTFSHDEEKRTRAHPRTQRSFARAKTCDTIIASRHLKPSPTMMMTAPRHCIQQSY